MSLGEFDIIARYFTRASGRSDVLVGVGDDAAVLAPPLNQRLVVAVDTIVEDVHFPGSIAPADIGYRALAVNLSDLAAMGATPSWMTLSLSLPNASEEWLGGFAAGLFELADRFEVALVGGDTVRGPLVITVQIGGWVEPDRWLTRSGARPGDRIYVSGTLGDAAAGLALIQQGREHPELRARFLRPTPRVELGRALRTVASAAMDVSDGLLTDLRKLCVASGCGAELNLDALPSSAALQAAFDRDARRRFAATGGDDYELVFTAPLNAQAAIDALQSQHAITEVGRLTAGQGVRCMSEGRSIEFETSGYDHFARGEGA